ncbi:hypothetical protein [Lolliginicoccus levis]|uniref:hypothetical protein n=1 Tax=Lolliginicoccus levis TaxID=2919542 RepID=UPI00241D5A18|nr:hypothetical protein [Lolliginicoccus levis]
MIERERAARAAVAGLPGGYDPQAGYVPAGSAGASVENLRSVARGARSEASLGQALMRDVAREAVAEIAENSPDPAAASQYTALHAEVGHDRARARAVESQASAELMALAMSGYIPARAYTLSPAPAVAPPVAGQARARTQGIER